MGQPVMEMLYRSGLADRSVLTAGSMPTVATTHANGNDTFQVAVTTGTAARLGLHVGSRLRTARQTLVVTGIVRPVDPASVFWTIDPIAATPQLTQLGIDATPFWTTGAFVGATEADELQRQLSTEPLHAVWSFPLDLSEVTADQASCRPPRTCRWPVRSARAWRSPEARAARSWSASAAG